jgi:hypothetical protein
MATLSSETIEGFAENLPRTLRAAAETLIDHAPRLRTSAALPILRRVPIGWVLAGIALVAVGYAAYNGTAALRSRADA